MTRQSNDATGASVLQPQEPVFVFFSNRLGCAGSLLVTVVLSALLIFIMRGCSTGYGTTY